MKRKFIKTSPASWENIERTKLIETILRQEDMLIEQEDKLIEYEKQLGKQRETIEQQEDRVKELEIRTNLNSENSSKPPSTDVYEKKRTPTSLREKTGRKPGGQPGHFGTTLQAVAEPDIIEKHDVTKCTACDHDLSNVPVSRTIKRQELDVPKIKPVVTEHQFASKTCPSCKTMNVAPKAKELTQAIQYGDNIKVLANYFNVEQHIPLERTVEVFKDVFGVNISEGTIVNMQCEMAVQVAPAVEHIKTELTNDKKAVHFDESSITINGRLGWAHVTCTPYMTLYEAHEKRGCEAMNAIGILPNFRGLPIHDDLAAYGTYQNNAGHGLCCEHFARELKSIFQNYENQPWAEKMRALLYHINCVVCTHKAQGDKEFPEALLNQFSSNYDSLLVEALPQIPIVKPSAQKKKGRQKQHPAKNLYDRLLKRKGDILRFMYDFRVPFTNNQAERDVRMIKLKAKISNGYRSRAGAERHLEIRSYTSTARKQGVSAYDALHEAIKGRPMKFYNRPNSRGP
jgi:transposase